MIAPNIKRMTPIVASRLSLIKYNPKIAINKPKNIHIINAIIIPTSLFQYLNLNQREGVEIDAHIL